YDNRGTGLSDWTVPEMSIETALDDLATVLDGLRVDRFSLLGISGGAATAISYAARHPERVSKLAICGGYARGRNKRGSSQYVAEAKAFYAMMQSGWGNDDSLFWRAFSSFFLPSGTPEQLKWFLDLQRVAFPVENAVRGRLAVDEIDVVNLLGKVRAP